MYCSNDQPSKSTSVNPDIATILEYKITKKLFVKKTPILLLLIFISAIIYYPWINNPLIFDDANILKSTTLFDYAQNPISLNPRQFPYFTLGFESVISDGNILVSRYVAMLLHAVNGFLLFLLTHQFIKRIASPQRALITALAISVIFVVHPIAVYAVGYLIQRTIIFATLFLLLSALQFNRAISENSWSRALLAGIFFGLATLSKEHAIFGFSAVLGILLINKSCHKPDRTSVILSFLATALPFVGWVVSLKLGVFASAYEPDAQQLMSAAGFPDAGSGLGNWILSVSLQCLFFFRYLFFWYLPDPSGLSIDIRPDFTLLSKFPWIVAGPVFFVALAGIVSFSLFSRKSRPELKLAAYGLFWAMALFLVEFSSIRFQEPIVLYRSYLWAPGILLALAGFTCLIPARIAITLAGLSVLVLSPLAWGRLATFSDELTLWKEAALHLPKANSAGAIRIHYNVGIFHARSGNLTEALHDFDWIILQDPKSFQGYWGRSAVHLSKNEWTLAATDLETVIHLKPDFGMAYFQYGVVLKRLGRSAESVAALSKAGALGILVNNLK